MLEIRLAGAYLNLRFHLHLAYVINEAHTVAVDSVQSPQNMHVNPNVKNIQTTWIITLKKHIEWLLFSIGFLLLSSWNSYQIEKWGSWTAKVA